MNESGNESGNSSMNASSNKPFYKCTIAGSGAVVRVALGTTLRVTLR